MNKNKGIIYMTTPKGTSGTESDKHRFHGSAASPAWRISFGIASGDVPNYVEPFFGSGAMCC